MVKHTQKICRLLSVFDRFVGLALKGLMVLYQINCIIIVDALCLLGNADHITLLETFDGIYSGKYLCDRELEFESLDSEEVACYIVCSESASNESVMTSPLSIRLCEVKKTGSSLFLHFEWQQKKTSEIKHNDINDVNETNE